MSGTGEGFNYCLLKSRFVALSISFYNTLQFYQCPVYTQEQAIGVLPRTDHSLTTHQASTLQLDHDSIFTESHQPNNLQHHQLICLNVLFVLRWCLFTCGDDCVIPKSQSRGFLRGPYGLVPPARLRRRSIPRSNRSLFWRLLTERRGWI